MLVRHKINGQLAEVDDEFGKELLATGHFVKPRKRAQQDAPQSELDRWLEAEKAYLETQE